MGVWAYGRMGVWACGRMENPASVGRKSRRAVDVGFRRFARAGFEPRPGLTTPPVLTYPGTGPRPRKIKNSA
jgi:hypothetical protein